MTDNQYPILIRRIPVASSLPELRHIHRNEIGDLVGVMQDVIHDPERGFPRLSLPGMYLQVCDRYGPSDQPWLMLDERQKPLAARLSLAILDDPGARQGLLISAQEMFEAIQAENELDKHPPITLLHLRGVKVLFSRYFRDILPELDEPLQEGVSCQDLARTLSDHLRFHIPADHADPEDLHFALFYMAAQCGIPEHRLRPLIPEQ